MTEDPQPPATESSGTSGEHSFSRYDAAYVLGALSPADRDAFVLHLRGCVACSTRVSELAGMPGLLRLVAPDVVEALATDTANLGPPVPADLLPRLITAVASERRQRRIRFSLLGAAAAACVGLLVAVWGPAGDDRTSATPSPTVTAAPTPSASGTPDRSLRLDAAAGATGSGVLPASAALTDVAWGTRIVLRCPYADTGPASWDTYALLVRAADGELSQVATWRGVPGRTLTIVAATSVRTREISSLEIRDPAGTPVLASP